MNPSIDMASNISGEIFSEVKEYLNEIERKHNVTIIQAIESGSRAWGFPSPDSDYDVRFVYAHPKDWYLSLFDQRDVIELPINDELDISGWDLRKALKLANNGNAVIQEWMISPIVYQQSAASSDLSKMVVQAFNPMGAYHHYRSMAKKAYADIEKSEQKKLKRFFYFARATLSAKWIAKNQTMPSIVFKDLVLGLIDDSVLVQGITELVERKSQEPERSLLEVPPIIYDFVGSMYRSLGEKPEFSRKPSLVSNINFQQLLSR